MSMHNLIHRSLLTAGLLLIAPLALAATFNVDNTGDAGDANPGNGSCAATAFGTSPCATAAR